MPATAAASQHELDALRRRVTTPASVGLLILRIGFAALLFVRGLAQAMHIDDFTTRVAQSSNPIPIGDSVAAWITGAAARRSTTSRSTRPPRRRRGARSRSVPTRPARIRPVRIRTVRIRTVSGVTGHCRRTRRTGPTTTSAGSSTAGPRGSLGTVLLDAARWCRVEPLSGTEGRSASGPAGHASAATW